MKRPFMCLYINDILGHENVQALDDLGFAYYMRMLMRAWKSQEAYKLPNTELALQIAAGCKDIDEWAKRRDLILLNWPESKDGKWRVNGRLKEEYQKMLAKHRARQAAGKKGGTAKAKASNATSKLKQNAQTQTQTQTQTKANTLTPAASRRKEFIDDLKLYMEHKNPGVKFHMTGKDGKQLDIFLADYPNVVLPRERFQKCLQHRARSDVNHAEAIYRWINRILDYENCPLDRFGKPLNGTNRQIRVDEKQQSLRDHNAKAIAELRRSVGVAVADEEPLREASGHAGRPALAASVIEIPHRDREEGTD